MYQVLYVDDEPDLLEITKLYLEISHEFAVDTATSAQEILDNRDLLVYDAIISDYQMPEMDGITFLKHLKAAGNTTPFIIFTGRGREEVVIEALNNGADFYLQKGGEPKSQYAELSNKIRYAISRKQAEESLKNRLVALTQPLEDTGIAFEDLFNIDEIQRLQDEFAKATGVASVITHTDGTPITKPSNFTRLCNDIIRKTERGRANCYRSDAVIGYPHMNGPIVQPCLSGGLWDAGASIVIGGRHIANWLIGQVRNETQTEDAMRKYARDIGVDEQTVLKAFREVPAMSSAKFEAIAQSLYTLANQLSKSAYQNVQQARFITDRKRAEEALRENEEWFKVLFEQSPIPYQSLDADGRFLAVNNAWLETLGYARNEVIGRWFGDFVTPDFSERFRVNFPRFKEAGEIHVEFDIKRKDGSAITVAFDGKIGHHPNGTFRQTHCIFQDITIRNETEKALIESEELNRNLLENLPDYITIYGPDGNILYINPAGARAFGFSAEKLVGTPFLSYIAEEHRDEVISSITRCREGGDDSLIETKILTLDGKKRSVTLKSSRVQYQDTSAVLVIFTDITIQNQVEEALRMGEGYLHLVSDNLTSGIVMVDAETHTIDLANPAAAALFGTTRDQIIGEKCHRFLCPAHEGASLITDLHQEAYTTEWMIMRSDGRRIPVLLSEKRIQIGGREKLLENFIDITNFKQAEEKQQENSRKYAELFELGSEAIFLIDNKTGALLEVNTAACEMYGYPRNLLLTMKNTDLSAEKEETKKITTKTPQGTVRVPLRYHRRNDGTVFPVEILGRFFIWNGRPVHIASIRDITERKRAEEALCHVNRKLTLLSGITRHDISNQLTVLMGNLGMLEDIQPDPSFSEYFRKATTAADRISAMIRFTKEYEQIGVNAPAWQDCRTLVETAAKQAQLGVVMVKNDIPAGTEVFADPLIVRVFYNLMDNAIRYGGKITIIRFSAQERDGDLFVVCEDDGDGIPAEEKERIFDRGFGKNTGLGLALSREILDITGITIQETGVPRAGARFELRVPKGMWSIVEKREK